MAYKNFNEIGRLNGAPYKFEPVCYTYYINERYIGEIICGIQKTNLVNTANEVIIYSTSMGGIGAFYPFETREVILISDFLKNISF